MMNLLTLLCGALFFFTRPVQCNETCKFSLEVLLLQDGSGSFKDHLDKMIAVMQSLVAKMQTAYDGVKFGISSFVDKPIPLRGMGPYGNWRGAYDYCYRSHSAMTENVGKVIKGLENLAGDLGSGNDFPENPLEGLIIAASDPTVGWSAPDVHYSPSGSPLVRIIVLITDDVPHFPDDADSAINNFWHIPRSYKDPANPMISSGGFGAHDFTKWQGALFLSTDADWTAYEELADLYALIDHKQELTAEQEARHAALVEQFGPNPFPEVVPYPGNSSIQCEKTEYPTVLDVGVNLKKANIHPIFLVAQPLAICAAQRRLCDAIGMNGGQDCLASLYSNWSTEMGFNPVTLPITGKDIEESIINAIQGMTDKLCLETTTPVPTDTDATTESKTTKATSQMASTEVSATGEAVGSTEKMSSSATSADPSKTEKTDDAPTEAHTTDEDVPIAPVVPGKSNIAVIAGAAGGAAAGVAAIAGGLYAKFGAGFTHSPVSDMAGVQQVETPEDPIEREIMEEVTIDLFQ